MKFFSVIVAGSDFGHLEGRKIFKIKTKAHDYLKEVKEFCPEEYQQHVEFEEVDISMGYKTVMAILNGEPYCNDIKRLDLP